MKERNPLRFRVLLQRPRDEAADHGFARNESGVGAGRKMRPVTHDGAYVSNIELPHRQVSLPADDVHGIERVHE